MLRPRPVPLPASLVVKKGSKTLLEHVGRHALAGVAHGDHDVVARPDAGARGASSDSDRLLVAMRRRPPSGMASRALMARLTSAVSSWARSISASHRPPRQHGLDLDHLAQRPAQQPDSAVDQLVDVDGDRLQRLPAREGEQLAGEVARPAAWRCRCAGCASRAAGRDRSRSSRTSRLAMMTIRMLLKSWATPPVSWPIASIFTAWRRAGGGVVVLRHVAADEVVAAVRFRPGRDPGQRDDAAVLVTEAVRGSAAPPRRGGPSRISCAVGLEVFGDQEAPGRRGRPSRRADSPARVGNSG